MIKFQQLVSHEQSRLGDERGVALIVYLLVLAIMSQTHDVGQGGSINRIDS